MFPAGPDEPQPRGCTTLERAIHVRLGLVGVPRHRRLTDVSPARRRRGLAAPRTPASSSAHTGRPPAGATAAARPSCERQRGGVEVETPPTLITARGGRGALTVYACVLRGHGSASPLPRGGGSRAPGCSVPCPLAEYRDHLVKQRHVVARLEINVEGTVLRSDLVDRTRLALIEAKGRSDRESIRTALGQIIDYERFMAPPPKHRGRARAGETYGRPACTDRRRRRDRNLADCPRIL